MAMGTSPTSRPPAPMAPTPGVGTHPPSGVGQMGPAPVIAPNEPARPVLLEDIDPVLLVRLYPAAKDAAEMRSEAMAAGQATYEAGLRTVASQQEPVVGAGGEPVPPQPSASTPPPPQQPHQAPHK